MEIVFDVKEVRRGGSWWLRRWRAGVWQLVEVVETPRSSSSSRQAAVGKREEEENMDMLLAGSLF